MSTVANSPSAEQILDVLARVAEQDEVRHDLDLRLYDLQILDSMKTVELIVALSEAFGIAISPADLERDQWQTPRAIVADVQRRLGA